MTTDDLTVDNDVTSIRGPIEPVDDATTMYLGALRTPPAWEYRSKAKQATDAQRHTAVFIRAGAIGEHLRATEEGRAELARQRARMDGIMAERAHEAAAEIERSKDPKVIKRRARDAKRMREYRAKHPKRDPVHLRLKGQPVTEEERQVRRERFYAMMRQDAAEKEAQRLAAGGAVLVLHLFVPAVPGQPLPTATGCCGKPFDKIVTTRESFTTNADAVTCPAYVHETESEDSLH